jgi:hypothetical protein
VDRVVACSLVRYEMYQDLCMKGRRVCRRHLLPLLLA